MINEKYYINLIFYLLLLFSKLGGYYATRPVCMWALQYVVFWIFSIFLAEILAKSRIILIIIPLEVAVMGFCAINLNNPYISSHGWRDYATCKTCKAVDDYYIIQQIVTTD